MLNKEIKKLIDLSATEYEDLWTHVRNKSNETESLLFSGGGEDSIETGCYGR